MIICMHNRLHLITDPVEKKKNEHGGQQEVRANKQPLFLTRKQGFRSRRTVYYLRDDFWSEIKKRLFFFDAAPVRG